MKYVQEFNLSFRSINISFIDYHEAASSKSGDATLGACWPCSFSSLTSSWGNQWPSQYLASNGNSTGGLIQTLRTILPLLSDKVNRTWQQRCMTRQQKCARTPTTWDKNDVIVELERHPTVTIRQQPIDCVDNLPELESYVSGVAKPGWIVIRQHAVYQRLRQNDRYIPDSFHGLMPIFGLNHLIEFCFVVSF